MDVLTSTEFRKRYGKLTSPTIVTANGHTIGMWTPGDPVALAAEGRREARAYTLALDPDFDKRFPPQRPFVEFRPVPKPGRK